MANTQVSAARPLGTSPLVAVSAAVALALIGFAFAQSPIETIVVLSALVGLVIAFMRPDLFVYFVAFTLPINFARSYQGIPLAVEELYVLAAPLIILHRVAGGRVVRRLRIKSVYVWPAAGLLIIIALSCFRASDFYSYVRGAGRFGGAVICAWAVLNIATTWDRQKKVIWSLLGGALFICLLIFAQVITREPTSIFFFIRGTTPTQFSPMRLEETVFVGRGMGLIGPSGSAHYLEVLLPIALYGLLVARSKFWPYLVLALLWAGTLLTFTAVPVLVGVAVSLLLGLLMRKLSLTFATAAMLIAGLGSALLSLTYVSGQLSERILLWQGELYQRLDLWKMGWDLFRMHPLVGVGFTNSSAYFMTWTGTLFSRSPWWIIGHPHQLYILVADELGVVGLGLYCWIWLRSLQLGFKAALDKGLGPRRFEVIALSCGSLALLLNGLTDSTLGGYQYWVLLGLIEATYRLVKPDVKLPAAKGADRVCSLDGGESRPTRGAFNRSGGELTRRWPA